ncbi:MAG TPA: penicillin-binding transpeptidase domain-containing protein [Chloroflexota bacterium]|nr:penicillin-binding transpeptidase domain-containing protein [Chloroflexota bacterium]
MRTYPSVEQTQRWRLLLIGLAVTTFAGLILQRLFWYQVTDRERFVALANEEHQERRPLAPARGALLDTNGHPIALNVMYDAVYVYRPALTSLDRAVTVLTAATGKTRDQVMDAIQRADKQWTLLASRLPANAASQIASAGLSGVELRSLPAREYPEGSLAAQVLGFVGADGSGLSGLELTLDDALAGKPGVVVTEGDTEGDEIAIGRKALIPPVPGSDVVLTIDRYIQRVAERELDRAVQANKATGGIVIVMNPTTGAVLAMATNPTFSLTSGAPLEASEQQLYKPVVVTDTYEPGSVMKLMTAAAGVEEGVVTPDSRYHDNGLALINGVPIRNWDGGAYGDVTVREILVHSLNTGAQWIAGLLGPDRFYRYIEAFGFGAPTGIQLNGEAAGSFRRNTDPGWSALDLATNSFGQSISVTPIQMITAIAALGNHGILMKPQIVKEIRGPDGVKRFDPQPVRSVVSDRTAETMLNMMESVWNQPALSAVHIAGYRLAAKSGTADIPAPNGYSTGKTYASFAGFAPLPNPRFVILVRIDRPEAIYGGVVAAPVFRAIASEILTYMQIPPTDVKVPPVDATAGQDRSDLAAADRPSR